MQDQSDVRSARVVIFWLVALVALLATASTASAQTTAGPKATAGLSPRLLAAASWHGRPIQRPWRMRRVELREDAADVARLRPGTGFARAGGSDRVRRLQRRLRRLGYRPGHVDGLFGPRTQASVIAFQRKHGLRQTGVVDPQTMRTLLRRTSVAAALAAQPVRRSQPQPEQTVATPAPATHAASGEGGREGAPLELLLGLMLLIPVLALAGMLARRRREDRRFAPASTVARHNGDPWRAVGYAVGDELAVRRQEEEIAAGCSRWRLELLEVVSDPPDAGAGVREMPGLRRVLRRVNDGEATTVVVSALDRLGHSDDEIRDLLWSVARAHANVVALNRDGETEEAAAGGREDREPEAAWCNREMKG